MDLPITAEVPVRTHPHRFWDGLIFGFTASLTLWQDLPPIEVPIVMVVLFGASLVALGGSE